MKNYFIAFGMLFSGAFLAQSNQNCGFNVAYEKLFEKNPQARDLFKQATQSNYNKISNNTSASNFTIPVVFHILHKGGSENISDAQIFDAITILNRDYRKLNADTANIVTQFKPIAADCNINFVLASLDPNGKCTNGITRHYDLKTNWTLDQEDYIYTWNPSKYLNIYVVRSMQGGGIAGYTYLPGGVPQTMDAVVALHSFVGSIGTSNAYNSRVLSHEVGHWLNLQHVWGSGNNPGVACGDDGVGDTPLTKGHSQCNLGNAIICTPAVTENIQNYMEYAYCSNMFTQGQKARMHVVLNNGPAGRENLSANANLIATGVVNPTFTCPPTAQFINATSVTCVGGSLPFVDWSYNAPVTNWEWSSNLSPAISTAQNGTLSFNNSGLAFIKLKVSNGFGSDSSIKQVVTVLPASTGSGNINVSQGFETAFPDNNWFISIPNYGSAFQQTTSASASGSVSAWINNYYDNPNGPVLIYSPSFNLVSAVTAQLSFKYAYAQQSLSNADRFKVYVSINCGSSWNVLYDVAGTPLSTTGAPVGGSFIPNTLQWKTENIDLLGYSNMPSVYFKFEFTPDVNGSGNNFYLDDINLSSVVGLNEFKNELKKVNVFPNPFTDEVIVDNNGNEGINSIKVYDVSSRLLKEIDLHEVKGRIVLKEAADLNKGIYFLELKSENNSRTLKLIKN